MLGDSQNNEAIVGLQFHLNRKENQAKKILNTNNFAKENYVVCSVKHKIWEKFDCFCKYKKMMLFTSL
jgi:hypothetical protein